MTVDRDRSDDTEPSTPAEQTQTEIDKADWFARAAALRSQVGPLIGVSTLDLLREGRER